MANLNFPLGPVLDQEYTDSNGTVWICTSATGPIWARKATLVVSAESTSYNNTSSGLSATDVNAAIDEVEGRVDNLEDFYTESATAPVSPSYGDEWLCTVNGRLYKYVFDGANAEWLDIGAGGNSPVIISGGGGGAWELIQPTTTIDTPVNFVEFTGLGSYSTYKIIVKDAINVAAGFIRLDISENSSYISSFVQNLFYTRSNSTSPTISNNTSATYLECGYVASTVATNYNEVIISNCNTTNLKQVKASFAFGINTTTVYAGHASGITKTSSSTVDKIKIASTGGNFTSGTFSLYGLTT